MINGWKKIFQGTPFELVYKKIEFGSQETREEIAVKIIPFFKESIDKVLKGANALK